MEYNYRKNANKGRWYCFLLPLSLFPLVFPFNNELYILSFIMSFYFCFYDVLKANISNCYFCFEYCNYFTKVCPIILSIFLWKYFSHYSCFFHVLTLSYAAIWFYDQLSTTLLKYCPGSFTLGEAKILSQSIVLFLISCEFLMFHKNLSSDFISFRIIPDYIKCLQVLLLGCFLLIYLLHLFTSLQRGVYFLSLLTITSFLMLLAWNNYLGKNIFQWILSFCLQNKLRVYLILFWLVCSFLTVLFVIYINLSSKHNNTPVIRKAFHFIITVVYAPGILYDIELLKLASGIVLTLFIILEMCRILSIPIIGPSVEDAFQIFLDEKDTGILILTHIYLLIGCSCPIWLYYTSPDVKECHIAFFSGIISVGIGDTIAAVCGKSFGRHKWKGSNKTIEGSFCNLVVQMIFSIYFFYLCDHNFTFYNMTLIAFATFLTTYMEAKTDQIDNLVLPLFMFSILSWIQ